MASCKDCIHYEACDIAAVYFGDTAGSKKFREYEKRTNVELDCDTFKDRSKFVELPCEVGDTVYVLSADNKIRTTSIEIISMFESSIIYLFNDGGHCYKNDIGETVFLTPEEAEKALEERKQ